jgi:hypothetical protein
VVVDLYQLYQAIVARGGIAPAAPDAEWAALLQAAAVTGAAAGGGGAAAMRGLFQSRIRGFLEFMADLVRQYELAKREGVRKQQAKAGRAAAAAAAAGARPGLQRPAPGGRSSGGGAAAAAAAQRSPGPEVPDPVPGDRLRSMLLWLRRGPLEFAEQPYAEASARNAALARRYKAAFGRVALAMRAPLPPELHQLFGVQAPAAPRRSGRTRQQTEQRRSSE